MSVGVGSSATVIHQSFRFGMNFDLSLTSDLYDVWYFLVFFNIFDLIFGCQRYPPIKKVNTLTPVRPSRKELSEVKTWLY